MFVIKIETTYKGTRGKPDVIVRSEPLKFVNNEAEAKAFSNNNNHLIRKYGDIKKKEFVFEKWTLADFAEYCREQFKEINGRFDNHRL